MSLGSVLNMARSAMNAQQTAVQIASQNISNAQTEGYSRQRVDLAASLPTLFPWGSVGTGVTIAGISRARDALLDATFRGDSGGAASAQTTSDALSQIQGIFGEPSDSGLSASLDAFWSSWSDLASDPTSSAAKSIVRQTGGNVASTLNRFARQLDALDQSNRQGMSQDIGQVNSLTKQIANANREIVAAESGGQSANDLRDTRDKMLDQLSTLVGGQVIEHGNGSVAVYISGRMLVDDTTVNQLAMTNGQPPTVSFAGSANPLDAVGGSLGAKVDILANRIPTVMARLDSMAAGIVQAVNAIHSTGQIFSGNPPVASAAGNFFDVTIPPPVGTDPRLTARGMRLSLTLASASDVAASGATATGPGNNDIASALAGLHDAMITFTTPGGVTIGTSSTGQFYQQTVSDLATSTRQAQDDATVQQTLASNAETRRQSVSGVSTDEELISVIEHQHAYQAAARLVNVVNDMTQTLIDLGR